MAGLGAQEFIIIAVLIFVVGFIIYGISMTIDAIRRPEDQFTLGKKMFWVIALIVTNPLISKFYGTIYLVCVPSFLTLSVVYHLKNRRNKPILKIKPYNQEAS